MLFTPNIALQGDASPAAQARAPELGGYALAKAVE